MNDNFLEYAVRCSLIEYLDKSVLVSLRDGKVLIGDLITFDQFGSIVLHNARQRKVSGNSYCDFKQQGSYIIRAENVVVIGDMDTEWAAKNDMRQVDEQEIEKLITEHQENSLVSQEALAFQAQ